MSSAVVTEPIDSRLGPETSPASSASQPSSSSPVDAIKRFHARMLGEHAWYALLFAMVQAFQRHEPARLAKQSAYSLLYAIPSMLLMLVSLAVLVDKNTGAEVSTSLQTAITEQVPDDAQPLLRTLVDNALVKTSENTAIFAFALSLGVAIWGASGGVGALMFAVNQVYDVRDTRSFIKATLIRLGLMLLGGILVIGAFLLFIIGRRVANELPTQILSEGSTLREFLLSGPLWALFLLFGSLLLLYWASLDIPKSVKWLLPGAALATLAVMVTFALLDFILSYANPGPAFGAAGGVIVLLWTLFILSQIVVIGAIVNAVLAHRHDPKMAAALEAHPEKWLDDCSRQRNEPNRAVTAQPVSNGIAARSHGSTATASPGVIVRADPDTVPPGSRNGTNRLRSLVHRLNLKLRMGGSTPRRPRVSRGNGRETFLLRLLAGAAILIQGPPKRTATKGISRQR